MGKRLIYGEVGDFEDNIVEKNVVVGEDNSKVNISEALKSKKTINGIEFSDIQLSQRDGETLLTATTKNIGSTASELLLVKLTLVDDEGQDMVTLKGRVSPLDVGATGKFETSSTLDFSNAYDFRLEVESELESNQEEKINE